MESSNQKPSSVGKFIARLGLRGRSKSPAKTHRTSPAIPKAPSIQFELPQPTERCASPPTPSRFGTLVNRLSKRRTKTSDKISDDCQSTGEGEVRGIDGWCSPARQKVRATPRPAVSESDLRHVTIRRAEDLPITPLKGATSFMSEDNLASAECGTPARRVPSYVKISCAANGYFRCPREPSVDSPVRSMPMSMVQRRLLRFDSPRTPSDGDRSPLGPATMGNQCSTPSPVKSLIGQFDRLNLCGTEKEEKPEKQGTGVKPHLIVVDQPTPINVVHPMDQKKEQLGSNDAHHVDNEENKENTNSNCPSDTQKKPKESINIEHVKPGTSKTEFTEDNKVEETKGNTENDSVKDSPSCTEIAARNTNGTTAAETENETSIRTGDDFERLLKCTKDSLETQSKQALQDLDTEENLPECAADAIRMASGKAQLLVRKKLSKFSELVQKNMHPIEGDPQPAMLDDLEGYWALVEIELVDIAQCFQKVSEMRERGWRVASPTSSEGSDASPRPIDPTNNNEKPVPKKTKTPINAGVRPQTEKQKEYDEKRKRMMAMMKAKRKAEAEVEQKENGGNNGLLIC